MHIRRQLLRSGTSAGANYQEALGSESRKDFVHKLQIALKELRESHYWLRLLSATDLMPKERLGAIVKEADELVAMTVKSIVTAKSRGEA